MDLQKDSISLELSVMPSGDITTNASEVCAQIKERLPHYDYVVDIDSKDDVKRAKEDRALLNKVAKALAGENSRMKKRLLASYAEAESVIKSTASAVTEASDKLNAQLRSGEARQKEYVRSRLEEFWNAECVGRYPFALGFDSKMLNKSAKFDESKEVLEARIRDLNADLEVLKKALPDRQSVEGVALIQEYCQTGDLAVCLRKIEAAKAEIERRRKAREEAERKKEESQPVRWQVPAQEPQEAFSGPAFEVPADPDITARWVVTAPKSVCAEAYRTLKKMGCKVVVEK